jgi:hypothetical protein
MELPVAKQAAQAALAFILGSGLGLVYDFIKAFRLRLRSGLGTALLDVVFCTAAALCLFAFGLGPGEGRLRLFMLIFVGLGGAAYAGLLSNTAMEIFSYFAGAAAAFLRPLRAAAVKFRAKLKKTFKSQKNVFQKIILWFTIIYNCAQDKPRLDSRSERSAGFETEKGKYVYEDRYFGTDGVRGDKPRVGTRKSGKSGSSARRAPAAGDGNDPEERRASVSDRSRNRRGNH